jgi:hypothetical protein
MTVVGRYRLLLAATRSRLLPGWARVHLASRACSFGALSQHLGMTASCGARGALRPAPFAVSRAGRLRSVRVEAWHALRKLSFASYVRSSQRVACASMSMLTVHSGASRAVPVRTVSGEMGFI